MCGLLSPSSSPAPPTRGLSGPAERSKIWLGHQYNGGPNLPIPLFKVAAKIRLKRIPTVSPGLDFSVLLLSAQSAIFKVLHSMYSRST